MVDCPLQCCSLFSVFSLFTSLYVSCTFINIYVISFYFFLCHLLWISFLHFLIFPLASVLSKQPFASPLIYVGSLIALVPHVHPSLYPYCIFIAYCPTWRAWQQSPLKYLYLWTKLHIIISQRTLIWIKEQVLTLE